MTPGFQTAVIFYSEQFAKQRELAVRFMTAYLKGARLRGGRVRQEGRGEEERGHRDPREGDRLRRVAAREGDPAGDRSQRAGERREPRGHPEVPGREGSQAAPIDLKAVVDLSFADEAVKALGAYK